MAIVTSLVVENVRVITAKVASTGLAYTSLEIEFDRDGPDVSIEIWGGGHAAYAARLVEGINRAAEEDAIV